MITIQNVSNAYPRKLTEFVNGAFLIAMGLLLPLLLHAFGLGSAFLPMFFPIILAGFLLTPYLAIAVGVLTPLTSALLTQMPPMFILPLMMVEGVFLAGIPAISRKRFAGSIWLVVLVTLLCDRVVLFFLVLWLAPLLKLPANLSAGAVVLKGIPGFILLLIFIPIIAKFFLARRDRGH